MKKVLFIFGGPRKNGNLSKMIKAAIDRANELNYESHYINLYEKNIALCRGCMKCKESTICIIKDDIQEIRELLIECDITVLASPTYFANVTAPMKNMFDRLVGAVMDDNGSDLPKPRLSRNHEFILMTTCTTPWPFDRLAKQSSGCLRAMREFLRMSGMKYRGEITFAGTRNKKELPKRVINKINKLIK